MSRTELARHLRSFLVSQGFQKTELLVLLDQAQAVSYLFGLAAAFILCLLWRCRNKIIGLNSHSFFKVYLTLFHYEKWLEWEITFFENSLTFRVRL